jgi:Aldo/keto reductase family
VLVLHFQTVCSHASFARWLLGEFYGQGATPANLELVARFFQKYPSYADRTFLSVKGGARHHSLEPDASPENLRRSVDYILEKLRGTKSLDLFECARNDPTYPLEDTLKVLQGFVKEGKFKYIGLSEVGAATVRRAHKVAPEVAAVEIEVSPWSYTQETKDGGLSYQFMSLLCIRAFADVFCSHRHLCRARHCCRWILVRVLLRMTTTQCLIYFSLVSQTTWTWLPYGPGQET